MRRAGNRNLRMLAYPAGLLALAAAASQLLLPRLAASRISSRVARYGEVRSVTVSAWPAVELLWKDADSVDVSAGALTLSPSEAQALLEEGSGTSRIHVSAQSVRLGPIALTDASLTRDGSVLIAQASVTAAAVAAALPTGVAVSLEGSEGGQVRVRVSGALFGLGASVRATAGPSDGRLIVTPEGSLLQAFNLTLFSEPPHLHRGCRRHRPERASADLPPHAQRENHLTRDGAPEPTCGSGTPARGPTTTGSPCIGLIVGIWWICMRKCSRYREREAREYQRGDRPHLELAKAHPDARARAAAEGDVGALRKGSASPRG